MTIFKYPLDQDNFADIPDDAKAISVGMQDGKVTLWAIVDPASETKYRQFQVYGTGEKINSMREDFIGTVFDGPFVWHVFK